MDADNVLGMTPAEKRNAAKKRALTVLEAPGVRFRMAVAFLICLCSVCCIYVVFSLLYFLILGQTVFSVPPVLERIIDAATFALSFVFTLPLIHAYKIMAARAGENENVNLLDLFMPYMDFRMCCRCFIISLFSFLSTALPVIGTLVCTFFDYKYFSIPLVVLLALPWYRLTAVSRLISDMHACNPYLSFGELLKMTGFRDRKEYFGLELSFSLETLLCIVTIFIFGIYRSFAYRQISLELFAGSILKNKLEDK